MPTYPTYKLGEICVIERGGSPRPIKDYLTKDDNGLNWIKIGDATLSNKYIYTTAEKIKPEGLSKTRMVESGDLILSNSMSFGRPYIMRTSGCIHDGWVVFRLNKDIIDEEYLYNILNSNEVYAQFNHLATGSTVKNLNIDRVKEVVIPLPPLPTQHAIVIRIETLFAELDKAVLHLRTAQQQLKTYRQAVLNHWLNNDDGKWEIVKLGEVAEIKRGRSKHRPRNDKSLFGGKYPFIQTGEIREANGGTITTYTQTYSEKGLEQSRLWPKGTLCLTIAANIAETAYLGFDACFPDSVVGILAQEDKLNLDYFNLFIQLVKQEIENKASATAQKNINVDFLENLNIALPPLTEQHRIVQEIESRLSQATATETYIENALQQAEALRQSILKKAFSGELV